MIKQNPAYCVEFDGNYVFHPGIENASDHVHELIHSDDPPKVIAIWKSGELIFVRCIIDVC